MKDLWNMGEGPETMETGGEELEMEQMENGPKKSKEKERYNYWQDTLVYEVKDRSFHLLVPLGLSHYSNAYHGYQTSY